MERRKEKGDDESEMSRNRRDKLSYLVVSSRQTPRPVAGGVLDVWAEITHGPELVSEDQLSRHPIRRLALRGKARSPKTHSASACSRQILHVIWISQKVTLDRG
jgi:hypothetical protein